MDFLSFNVFLSYFKDKENVILAPISRTQYTLLNSSISVHIISVVIVKRYTIPKYIKEIKTSKFLFLTELKKLGLLLIFIGQ